jgi:hypothetical protein
VFGRRPKRRRRAKDNLPSRQPPQKAASPGDGEAKVPVLPPTLTSGAAAYPPGVLEIEVSDPGWLRGSAPLTGDFFVCVHGI